MMRDFAHAAPTPLLSGYVLGIMFSRDRPDELEIPPAEWIARANSVADPEFRGMALGCAFMAALAGAATRPPVANRPSRSSNGSRNKTSERSLRNPS